jgi:hypothetical protein
MLANVRYQRKKTEAEVAELKKQLRVLRKEFASEGERRAAERAVMILPPKSSR